MSKRAVTDDNTDEIKEQVSVEEFESLQTELSNLQSQFDEMTGQFKRAVADYQNLEKRVSEGKAEFATWASSELVKRLLPVLDNLEKVAAGTGEEERKSGWFKGVEMAVVQFRQVLKNEGLEELKADGQFDPALHEAVDTREGENDQILEVVEKGYTLNGKILRPTRVIVGRK